MMLGADEDCSRPFFLAILHVRRWAPGMKMKGNTSVSWVAAAAAAAVVVEIAGGGILIFFHKVADFDGKVLGGGSCGLLVLLLVLLHALRWMKPGFDFDKADDDDDEDSFEDPDSDPCC